MQFDSGCGRRGVLGQYLFRAVGTKHTGWTPDDWAMLAVVLISTAGRARFPPRFRQHMHAKHVSGLTMVDYSGGRGGEDGGKGVWMGGGKVMDGDKVVECWCAAC